MDTPHQAAVTAHRGLGRHLQVCLPLLSQVRLLPSCSPYSSRRGSLVDFHDQPSDHPPLRAPQRPGPSGLPWRHELRTLTLTPSASPEILWAPPCSAHWGKLRLRQDYKDHTHCPDARPPLSPCQQSPGFSILCLCCYDIIRNLNSFCNHKGH